MLESIDNDDVFAVMTSLSVPYEAAIELIKNGLNVNYIRGGLKNEINAELIDLTTAYKSRITEMLKDSI